jgi:leader peptidase (prepilin peptidase) / N-methyltransferase
MDIAMIETVIAFFAGLLIGSFLNVCVFRLPRDLSVVKPRSFCPGCEKTIAWYDNIPVLSFLILRARCRHCGLRIPWRYPLVELATAIAFAVCAAYLGVNVVGAKYAIFGAILIGLIATDFEERILPDEFTKGGIVAGLVFSAFVPMDPGFAQILFWSAVRGLSSGPRLLSIGESAIGAAVASGLIWLLGWLYQKIRHREGLGFGDVKMIGMIGAFLGLQAALLTLMLGSMVGAVGGIIYTFATRKKAATYELPFGSFLGLAAIGIAVYGRILVAWYQRAGK